MAPLFVGLTQVQFANAVGEDSEVLEVEVRAYRRLIKRKRYRRTCQCTGARRVVTAAAPPRLIPKGILGISIWVMVLIDKYRLYRPTYRLLEALRIHGLDLALGTVTDGLKRLAPLFRRCGRRARPQPHGRPLARRRDRVGIA